MGDDRVDSLSDLEKEALRAFLLSSDQKEVARRIGRSPATVEQRLARARRKLGVGRSLDAALILAKAEGVETYGTALYADPVRGRTDPPMFRLEPPKEHEPVPHLALLPTRGRPWNTLPAWTRLALILGGMLALLVVTIAAFAIEEAATRIVQQHR